MIAHWKWCVIWIACIAAIGCSGGTDRAPDDRIIGAWSHEDEAQLGGGMASTATILEFKEDGTLTMSQGTTFDFMKGRHERKMSGTYQIAEEGNNKLILTITDEDGKEGGDAEVKFTDDDTFTIRPIDESRGELEYKRVK